jgi:hypothetical protein
MMRADGAINLHASGVEAIDPATLDIPVGDPWGLPRVFEEALAGWLGVRADEVLFTPGATGGTLLALLTLATPDSEVLVEQPIYEPMLRQAMRLARVKRLRRPRELGFALPVEQARAALTDATRLVMITEPHNPSGRFAPREQVLELADVALRHGAVLLVNEVYRGYADRPSYHGAAENIVVVSSLSKLMGAYWARLGWLSGTRDRIGLLRRAHMNMGMETKPAAAFGIAILRSAEDRRRRAAVVARAGIEPVSQWVEATGGVDWTPSQGPGFGSIALPAGTDDVALAERLHDEHGVLVVPGRLFEEPGTLRLSWLQAGARLGEGLSLVARALAEMGREL